MKKFFSLCLISLVSFALYAQSADNEDEVVKIERFNRQTWREGEVLVKFRPAANVQVRRSPQGKYMATSASPVNSVLQRLEIEEAEPLMPYAGAKVSKKKMRAFNGTEVKDTDLSSLYRLRMKEGTTTDIRQAVEQLAALAEVEYAEPNYIVYALGTEAEGDRIFDGNLNGSDATTYRREPLYSQQWGPVAINLPALWRQPKATDKKPVIAIIDTGVDTEHPDLVNNIYTNEAELGGKEGQDDDGNGLVDDLHGYDFVNQTGKMADYNGHGTHCAGIAAATGNNGIGITGANPDALILPITVMQSDGTGDVATIIKGIDYAVACGADVISMSFGGYAYSIAEEQALGKAYASAVLVAAAGNDGHDLTGYHCRNDRPMYPAALQFVLGVEASQPIVGLYGFRAGFSNYDEDGPLYSSYSSENQLYNYELRAPGVGIMSTFPNGRYKAMNGTSMATPLAAGAISRLLQCKDYASKEILFGDLIHTRSAITGNIDIMDAYNITDQDRQPTLSLVTYQLTDTLGDNDGRADAGDTLAIYPVLRNDWGQAENIKIWIERDELEDPTLLTFLTDKVDFGKPLSSYAKSRSDNPIRIAVNKNVVDGRHINLTLFATCDNMSETLVQPIVLEVENGVEIGGMITKDMTLYPGVHYIVTKSLALPDGVTLTIKPGTVLRFKDNTGLSVAENGHIIANGKPDSLIVFTKTTKTKFDKGECEFNLSDDTLRYCRFTFLRAPGFKTVLCQNVYFEHCILDNNLTKFCGDTKLTQSIITENRGPSPGGLFNSYDDPGNDKNIICNNIYGAITIVPIYLEEINQDNIVFNNCDDDGLLQNFELITTRPMVITVPQYWGSDREDIIRQGIWDMNHPEVSATFCHYDLSTRNHRPSPLAHGVVWKIVVNGYDAQDEFEQLPPLGVGTHKVEVYFNRAMDTIYTPTISMGVRAPYTQVPIAENGCWSQDSTVYTAHFTITGKTATDGLNRLYVYGAKDTDHFDAPEEKMRFNVQVSAAGSLATGLMAEAGLGKVNLTWVTDEEDFADLLGYNIYRWTGDTIRWDKYYDYEKGEWIAAGWRIDTLQINTAVLDPQEQSFTDYDVVPGKTYYYVIKQLTTALTSYNLSNPVAATPLTAQKGDANGSMSVDVADVVTEISHLTGGNPQPFIFEAADVNTDGTVNILDVVATINIIAHPDAASLAFSADNTAVYTVEDGIIYVETPVVLGGLQFTIAAEGNPTFEAMEALQGFEQVSSPLGGNSYLFMAYSMSGKTIPVGKHALLRIGNADVESIVLSNPQGQNIPAIRGEATGLSVTESMQLRLPNPNPFTDEVSIPYVIGQNGTHEVELLFTNVAGMPVHRYTANQTFGEYTYLWRAAALPTGIYFVTFYADGKAMQTCKLIHIR